MQARGSVIFFSDKGRGARRPSQRKSVHKVEHLIAGSGSKIKAVRCEDYFASAKKKREREAGNECSTSLLWWILQ